MKKLVSAASAVLLAMSLAACGADEEKEVEVPASTIASQTKAEDTKVTITEFLWDREIVCRPRPDAMFSAYWDDGSHRGTPEQKLGMRHAMKI